MTFKRTVPANSVELGKYLQQLHQNRKHLQSVRVDVAGGRIEVDLDGKANFFGYPDIYLPIARGKEDTARDLVERILSQMNQGFPPSDGDAAALFEVIDPTGR